MSVDYYCVPTDDVDSARAIMNGGSPQSAAPLDKEELALRLLRRLPSFERFILDYEEIARVQNMSVEIARAQFNYIELNWQEDGYIQVTIQDSHVSVSHGPGGRRQLAALETIFDEMKTAGLNIYDSQNDEMM
jgi:hypothetical protein